MAGIDGHARVTQHIAAFNAAVKSRDWRLFANRFAPEATMRFIGVPAGPFAGRVAIARAYAMQPPTDTLIPHRMDSTDAVDTVEFAWSSGGTGVMRLRWEGDLISELTVTFDS